MEALKQTMKVVDLAKRLSYESSLLRRTPKVVGKVNWWIEDFLKFRSHDRKTFSRAGCTKTLEDWDVCKDAQK